MLAIRCGVAVDDNSLNLKRDWAVLTSDLNPKFNPDCFINSFRTERSLHIFASATALVSFMQDWEKLGDEHRNLLKPLEMFGCGVGSTTDGLVKNLQKQGPRMKWNFPDLTANGQRENGLLWTLEHLEKKGLLPKCDLNLWSKTWSTSEKILGEYRSQRQWTSWKTTTHEIYSLGTRPDSIPNQVILALVKKEPVCFGVRSGEVLDATLTLLLEHLKKSSASELPRNIHFSVWEKSALLRAQQLFLQSRLIPATDFEQQIGSGENKDDF